MFGLFGKNEESENCSKELSIEEQLFKPILDISRDAVIIVRNRRMVAYANHTMKKIYMIPNNKNLSDLDKEPLFYTPIKHDWLNISQLIEYHDSRNTKFDTVLIDIKLKAPDQYFEGLTVNIKSIEIKNSRDIYHIIDIPDPQAEHKNSIQRYTNTFSGLPNQHKAFQEITSLTNVVSKDNRFAIIIVELDNFAKLRGMLGFQGMNDLILLIANRLKEFEKIDEKYKIYQMLHEDFLILIEKIESRKDIYKAIEIFNDLMEPVKKNKRLKDQHITFSKGVGLFPENGTLIDLFNSAYSALAEAKSRGEGEMVIASSNMAVKVYEEIQIAGEIKDAIKNKEFELFYQPIIDGNTFKIKGAEVLLRWRHPTKGMIMPGLFISVAEKSGLIMDLTYYVLENAMIQMERWKQFGFPPIQLSVNLSMRDLENHDFIDNFTALLNSHDFAPFKLKAEVTESASMANPELTKKRLLQLKELGLDISLDDFGTGYSSFAYLADFPVDTLKIDRSFVTDIDKNKRNQNIVNMIIKLAHTLKMNVIVEGVETKREVEVIRQYGADFFQGYYFSKPLPLLEFQHLLQGGGKK